jgi:hypothetical protein
MDKYTLTLVLFLTASCAAGSGSPSTSVRSPEPLKSTIANTAPSVESAVTVAKSPSVEPSVVDGDIRQGEVYGSGGFRARVSWFTDTGTMHAAHELELLTKNGTLHYAEADFVQDGASDALHAEALPLVDRIITIAPDRWIVLGWSTPGEGMQAVHAWLVDDTATGPKVVDSLLWMTDREHAGFVLDSATHRVGIPLPDSSSLHVPELWYLRHDGQQLAFDAVQKQRTQLAQLAEYYGPPTSDSPAQRHWSSRVLWFDAHQRFDAVN